MEQTQERIREVLAQHGRMSADVSALSPGADLYQHGLTSHATVNVMLALEDEFDVEFPDEALRKSTFASIDAIQQLIESLTAAAV